MLLRRLGNMRFGLMMLLILFVSASTAQEQTQIIKGRLLDIQQKPIESATIIIASTQLGSTSNEDGVFQLQLPVRLKDIKLIISHISFQDQVIHINVDTLSEALQIILQEQQYEIDPVNIEDQEFRAKSSMQKLDPKLANVLPDASGNIEGLLKSLPGVNSSSELSSQYSVRGGNFDENLVYVNDFEIYRPQLVRSGQQEGLSFVNSAMVRDLSFSSGGFEAKYGDKMASVLDIKYKRPTEFKGSVMASLLGTSVFVQGNKDKLSGMLGFRYKTNRYLLSGLNTQGDYRPSFTDIQGLLHYQVSKKWQVEALGNFSGNLFRFVPETRETDFGTVSSALRLTVFFEGEELVQYNTSFAGLSTTYRPVKNLQLKWLISGFMTDEREAVDVIGQYWLDEIESNLGDEDFGQSRRSLGVGTYHDNIRNNLKAYVFNAAHRGQWEKGNHYVQWGAGFKHEQIEDQLKEWRRVDSAGYSLPYSETEVLLSEVLKTDIQLRSNRITGYVQDNVIISKANNIYFNAGIRTQYWTLNKQLMISPRGQVSFQPNWEKDVLFKVASGIYYQAPFYRELRDLFGIVNTDVKAQRSVHYVAGMDYNFNAWKRPFKFTSEVYYKSFTHLIPYELQNVRIRYYGDNVATGFATGVDFRVYGEFVKNAESWFSLSVLQTREDLANDFYYEKYNSEGVKITPSIFNQTAADSIRVEPGFIARPTDQRVTLNIFFQDYVPTSENLKVGLNLVFGTGLPFGIADKKRYNDVFRAPPYRRVDLSFSALLLDQAKKQRTSILKNARKLWLSLEIFNLLQVNNTISYLWVKDVSNTTYAIPNYLTSRRVNVKVLVDL